MAHISGPIHPTCTRNQDSGPQNDSSQGSPICMLSAHVTSLAVQESGGVYKGGC